MSKNATTRSYNAQDELDRRAANKKCAPADKAPAPSTADGKRLSHMGGDALRAEAGPQTTPAPKPAPVKAEPKVKDPHTALRQQAWNYRAAQYRAGVKVTYAAACAKFGTTPAKKSA